MIWKTVDSSNPLVVNNWDKLVAPKSCINTLQFIKSLEKSLDSHEIQFLFAFDQEEKIVGLSLVSLVNYDLVQTMPNWCKKIVKIVRKIFPKFLFIKVALTSTMEDYGLHFWYDDSFWNLSEFLTSLKEAIKTNIKKHSALVIRDFIDIEMDKVVVKGMKKIKTIPCSLLDISGYSNQEEYLQSLTSKNRFTVKKAIKKRKAGNVSVNIIDDFIPFIKKNYHLYLAVNSNATEFKSPPLPIEFFVSAKEIFKDKCKILSMEQNKEVIGFAVYFLTSNCMNVLCVGLNYSMHKEFYTMYNLLWECIILSIDQSLESVELGVTNYFVKERFGAVTSDMEALITANSPILNKIINTIV